MMKISLIQQNIAWASPGQNRQKLERLMEGAERADLYVLPEMFSTGFATAPEGVAEEDLSSLLWMQDIAGRLDAAVAGSVAVKEAEGRYCNRFYFVKPDGDYCFYDKRHLFTYGGEDKRYTPGDKRVIVEWRGVRFMLQVCYDLRFPVFARNHEDYDCLLYVANWPDSRRGVWDILLRARALENQCYVAGVNRVGDDGVCHYDGGTALIDAYGKTQCSAENDAEQVITCTLDMDRLKRFREKFPVLKDRDVTCILN